MKNIYVERKGLHENRVEVILHNVDDNYYILEVITTIKGDEKAELTAYKNVYETDLIRLAIQAFDAAVDNHPVLGKETE